MKAKQLDGAIRDAIRFKRDLGNYSGYGSTMEATIDIRTHLPFIIRKYEIRSILDVPCGDCSWMKEINLHPASYTGYDIVDFVLDEARLNMPDGIFHLRDVFQGPIDKVDLIICRDFMFHISTSMGVDLLRLFHDSGSKYLLATSFPSVKANYDTNVVTNGPYIDDCEYNFRPINLLKEPYSLPVPLYWFKETDPVCQDRIMGLWDLKLI